MRKSISASGCVGQASESSSVSLFTLPILARAFKAYCRTWGFSSPNNPSNDLREKGLDEGTNLWEITQVSIDIPSRSRGKTMARVAELDELILQAIQNLKESERKEVMNFIEFLKIKEDNTFIEYVNQRTEEALEAKKRGKRFISLEELQKDYA